MFQLVVKRVNCLLDSVISTLQPSEDFNMIPRDVVNGAPKLRYYDMSVAMGKEGKDILWLS